MKHSITKYIEGEYLNFNKLVSELQVNVDLGFINKKVEGDLHLYDYTNLCTYERAWNDATRIARGLVLDVHNREVVSLPFEKFFNVGGEHDQHGLELGEYNEEGFFEKMDGSCAIIYFYGGVWRVNTRGSFESEQAIKAKEILDNTINTEGLDTNLTYIAEVIYEDNKIVVSYGDREGLVLTGCFATKFTKDYDLGWEILIDYDRMESLGFQIPGVYTFESFKTAQEVSNGYTKDKEGFVYRSRNGVRVKIKGSEYCRVHGLITYHTPLFLWREFVDNGYEGCVKRKLEIPEELWDELDEWLDIFKSNLDYVVDQTKRQALIFSHLSDKELGLEMGNIKQSYKNLFFPLRNDENFGTVGTKSYKTICGLFEPKNNVIKKLY